LFFVLIYLSPLIEKNQCNFINFMVCEAVGSMSSIMGNKIKQPYFHRDRYFETAIETGSNSVAAGLIHICNDG